MHVGLFRRDGRGGLEFLDRFIGPAETVIGLAQEHVYGNRVGRLFQDVAEEIQHLLLLSAPQITFGQEVLHGWVIRLSRDQFFELPARRLELLLRIIGHRQQ